MFKRFDRFLRQCNPDGTYLTTLKDPETGHNIPSIADFQLINEFLDYRHFGKGELDSLKWRELYPRLVKWHDTMLFSESQQAQAENRGVRSVYRDFDPVLPEMLKKQYCEDK